MNASSHLSFEPSFDFGDVSLLVSTAILVSAELVESLMRRRHEAILGYTRPKYSADEWLFIHNSHLASRLVHAWRGVDGGWLDDVRQIVGLSGSSREYRPEQRREQTFTDTLDKMVDDLLPVVKHYIDEGQLPPFDRHRTMVKDVGVDVLLVSAATQGTWNLPEDDMFASCQRNAMAATNALVRTAARGL